MKNLFLLSFFCIVVSGMAQTPLITEWQFSNTTNTQFVTRGSADYIIKNASDQIVSSGSLVEGTNIINVPEIGVFTMEISNSSNFAFRGSGDNPFDEIFPQELKKLLQWGDTDLNNDLTGMFAHSRIEITAEDIPDFKPDTNLSLLFFAALYFNDDLSGWDVSNVTDMQGMFFFAESFTGDISGWDVSNVMDMKLMFNYATSFTGDLSGWDVSSVTDMEGMFAYAPSFTSDLSDWDVSNVMNMIYMFTGASSFTSDLSGWDISGVTTLNSIFTDSGMSCDDYSRTLIGWADQNVKSYVDLGAENIYYGPAAVTARDFLISNKNWSITGDIYNEDCALDVNDMNLISDIKVINPVKDRIQVITEEKIDRVTVYDTSGKKVKEYTGPTASAEGLPKGIYILMIQTPKGAKSIKVLKD